MPHVIIEYTPDAVATAAGDSLVDAVHLAVLHSSLFEPEHVKTRAHETGCYRSGRRDRPFIHVQLRIKPGRGDAQKQALSSAVLAAAREAAPQAQVITVEVVDMDACSYAKHDAALVDR